MNRGAPGRLREAVAAQVKAALELAASVGVKAREYVFRWRDAISEMAIAPHLVGAADVLSRNASTHQPVVWLSYESLARAWRVTVRQAIARVHALEAAGALVKFLRHRREDRDEREARSNVYVLAAPLEAFREALLRRKRRHEVGTVTMEDGSATSGAAHASETLSEMNENVMLEEDAASDEHASLEERASCASEGSPCRPSADARNDAHRAAPRDTNSRSAKAGVSARSVGSAGSAGSRKHPVCPEEVQLVLDAIRAAPELCDLEREAEKLVRIGRSFKKSTSDVCRALDELAAKTPSGSRATLREAVGFVRMVTPEMRGVEYAADTAEPTHAYDAAFTASAGRSLLKAIGGGEPPARVA